MMDLGLKDEDSEEEMKRDHECSDELTSNGCVEIMKEGKRQPSAATHRVSDSSKVYCVVRFKESREVDVIPVRWFVDKTRQSCHWPPGRNSDAVSAAKQLADPQATWTQLSVRQIGADMDNYDEALRMSKKAEMSSDIHSKRQSNKWKRRSSDCESSDVEPPSGDETWTPDIKRVKRSKLKTKTEVHKKTNHAHRSIIEAEESSDSDLSMSCDDDLQSPLHNSSTIPTDKRTVSKNQSSGNGKHVLTSNGLTSVKTPSNRYGKEPQCSDGNGKKMQCPSGNGKEPQCSGGDGKKPQCSSGNGKEPQCSVDNELLQSIHQMLVDIKATLDMHENLLTTLVTQRELMTDDTAIPDEHEPFDSLEAMKAADADFADEELQHTMVSTLAKIGGLTLQQMVKRIFRYMMTREVEYCLVLERPKANTGKMAFKSFKLFKIMLKAVKLNPATSRHCDAEVEAAMAKYLINSRDRSGGQKQLQRLKSRRNLE